MEAVARNDHLKIRELQIRYSTRRTDRRTSPSARPSTSNTSAMATPSTFDPDSPGHSSAATQSPYANRDGDNEALVSMTVHSMRYHHFQLHRRKKKGSLDGLTVQSYLDKYTSEDNASFEELAELHNKRERVRNSWMYEAEKKHNEELVFKAPKPIAAADEQLLAIANGGGN